MGFRSEKPVTNRLSYDTTFFTIMQPQNRFAVKFEAILKALHDFRVRVTVVGLLQKNET
jgi:hypothetical protein